MENSDKKKLKPGFVPVVIPDKTSPDKDADKTGTDTDSDKTRTEDADKNEGENKFGKPAKEKDPDTTGIEPPIQIEGANSSTIN